MTDDCGGGWRNRAGVTVKNNEPLWADTERGFERAKKEGRTVWKEDVYVDVESATVYERAALQKLLGACRSVAVGLGGTTRCMFLGRTGWPVPGWIS